MSELPDRLDHFIAGAWSPSAHEAAFRTGTSQPGYVILKPAEWSPLSASLLPEIMTEAGVPDGVFNMVHGIGEVAGAALVTHPLVPRISFTGETSTGQVIMAAAAPGLKGLSMELG